MMIGLSDWLVSLADSYTGEYYAYRITVGTGGYYMKVRKVTSYKDPAARTVVVIWRPTSDCGYDSGSSYISLMLQFDPNTTVIIFGRLEIYGMEGVRWCDLLIVDNISLGEAF